MYDLMRVDFAQNSGEGISSQDVVSCSVLLSLNISVHHHESRLCFEASRQDGWCNWLVRQLELMLVPMCVGLDTVGQG